MPTKLELEREKRRAQLRAERAEYARERRRTQAMEKEKQKEIDLAKKESWQGKGGVPYWMKIRRKVQVPPGPPFTHRGFPRRGYTYLRLSGAGEPILKDMSVRAREYMRTRETLRRLILANLAHPSTNRFTLDEDERKLRAAIDLAYANDEISSGDRVYLANYLDGQARRKKAGFIGM